MSHCTVGRQHRGVKLHQNRKEKALGTAAWVHWHAVCQRWWLGAHYRCPTPDWRAWVMLHLCINHQGDYHSINEKWSNNMLTRCWKTESWTIQRALVLTNWTQWRSNVGMNHKSLPIATNKPHHSATKILIISNMLVGKVFLFLFNVH